MSWFSKQAKSVGKIASSVGKGLGVISPGSGLVGELLEDNKRENSSPTTTTATAENVIKYAQQVAGALGYTLTDDQLANISSIYAGSGTLDEVRDLITAAVNTYGAKNYRNPTVTPEQTTDVNTLFQSVYGREASEDEMDYFARELAQGKSKYELSQELQSLPEYQRVQAAKDRSDLDTALQTQQAEVFKRATPQIISAFMKAGRLNSSGLNAALAQAQADLDQERQTSLAQVGATDAATIRANAFNQFQLANQPYQNASKVFSTAGAYGTGSGYVNQGINRLRELMDYNKQQSDYQRYLNQQLDAQDTAAKYNLFGQLGGATIGALI